MGGWSVSRPDNDAADAAATADNMNSPKPNWKPKLQIFQFDH
jgi:hypothetical protein